MIKSTLPRFILLTALVIILFAVFLPGAALADGDADTEVRAPVGEAEFSGLLEKRATLSTTSIAFLPEDFTPYYTANGAGPLTGIWITDGDSGYLLLGESNYELGSYIPIDEIKNLRFRITDPGIYGYHVYADNTGDPNNPKHIGEVTLRLVVDSSSSSSALDEITYDVSANSYKFFDDRDFNSVFRDYTGRNLYYVRFTQPSSSRGILYYNYSSYGDFDYTITSSQSFYREASSSQSRYISNVAIVPREDYIGTFTISYVAYDDNNRAYNGTIRVRVDDAIPGNINNNYAQINSVTYSTAIGTPVIFSSSDFSASFLTATNYTLSHIRFGTLPSTANGRLYYNYNASTATSSGTLSTDLRYYVNAAPDISLITFVPAQNYAGTVNINYTAYATNGAAFAGTLYIKVGQMTSSIPLGDINYTAGWNTALTFKADDFQSVLTKAANVTLSYIMFTELPDSGTLYYNYRKANDYDSAVTLSARYFRSTNPAISFISYVPGSGMAGKVNIKYTAYTSGGMAYNGRIVISPASAGRLRTITFKSFGGEPFYFDDAGVDADIRAEVRRAAGQASGEKLSHVIFKLPSGRTGTLYTDYADRGGSAGRRKTVAEGEIFYDDKSPYISDLAFVAETSGNIRLDYTAFTVSGMMFDGRISIRQVTMPAGWARDEVLSLASRGVVPERMLSDYGKNITRAEFTALLVRTYDYSTLSTRVAPRRIAAFTDILNHRYARQINRGYALMIIDGVADTLFDPDSPLKREEAAKILCAAVGAITGTDVESDAGVPYDDRGTISEWALPYVSYAYERGLMIGDDENRFNAQSNLSREEAMALVERAIVQYRM